MTVRLQILVLFYISISKFFREDTIKVQIFNQKKKSINYVLIGQRLKWVNLNT